MFLVALTDKIAQFLIDHWTWFTGLGTVAIVGMLLDIMFNSLRRSLSRKLFQQLEAGKERYERWKDWLQADYHPGLRDVKKYFVDRPYSRDLPRERVEQLSAATEVGEKAEWPHDWPDPTGSTFADRFVNRRGKWLRGNFRRRTGQLPEIHLITANGGMGKSALLSFLFVRVAQNWRNFLPFVQNQPIYLHHLREEQLPWQPGGSLFHLPDHKFSGAVLLFDDLGMGSNDLHRKPASIIRAAQAAYPQARSIIFAGRTTDLLPYWEELVALRDEADDIDFSIHHLLPFRPEKEAEVFIQRRFSFLSNHRDRARELVLKNPIFQRPLFLSYLPLCLEKVYFFNPEVWANYDFAGKGSSPPPEGLSKILQRTFRQGYYGEATWRHLVNDLFNDENPDLSETEHHWLREQSPFLFDRLFQIAGPGLSMDRSSEQLFNRPGPLLNLIVDQWLYREISRPSSSQKDIFRAEELHAFCRRWAIKKFQEDQKNLLAPYPWPTNEAKPTRGFGSVLTRVYDPDPGRSFFRFAHRSVAEYFLAEALLRREFPILAFDDMQSDAILQYAGELYANNLKGQNEISRLVEQEGVSVDEITSLRMSFSDFDPFLLLAISHPKELKLVEKEREILTINKKNLKSRLFTEAKQAFQRVEKLDLSKLDLEDEDIDALAFFPNLLELDLSHNLLRSPVFEILPKKLKKLIIKNNPLGSNAGVTLLERVKDSDLLIEIGQNNFSAEQILEMSMRHYRFSFEVAAYENYEGEPLAYLLVNELPLHIAQSWLRANPTAVNKKGKNKETALMLACRHNDTATVEALIRAGAQLDIQKANGATALILACQHNDTATVEALIKAGAKLDIQTDNGGTALILACQDNDTATVEALIKAGAKLDIQADNGGTALMIACQHNDTATVEALIRAGAKLDTQTDDGVTALMIACKYNNKTTVEALIRAGTKLDIQVAEGVTALMLACQHNDTATVEALIKAGTKLDIQTADGGTALILACQHNDTATVEALIKAGAKLDIQADNGATALMVACRYNDAATVKVLIAGGAQLDIREDDGWTALMFACRYNDAATVEALIAAGAQLNIQKDDGITAFILACTTNDTTTVEALIAADAQLDIQTNTGWTALITLAGNEIFKMADSHANLLYLLSTEKCNLYIREENGFTALEIAQFQECYHNARAIRAAQTGDFKYENLLEKWERYKMMMGIETYSNPKERAKRAKELNG